MLFNSFTFIVCFLPVSLLLYYGCARLGRGAAASSLLLGSLFFYGWWDARYVPLLLASIGFNYAVGRALAARRAKPLLVFAVACNLLLLGYFKYTAFFLETYNALAGAQMLVPKIVLPLGISFFTFTQTAFLIDVYRGTARGASFTAYALFVTVFPHLIAGPVLHYQSMAPQFSAERTYRLDYDNLARGLMLFVLGLFKKVMIADKLAVQVDAAYAHTASLGFVDAWLASLGYTMQLYFDFSGYSEMAVGLALLFNLHLPWNFDAPYRARSLVDFWRRWHMTLGAWVRDYLYIPRGGGRRGARRKYFNLFFSMLLIGLWHGAGWTFVAWGALHGLALLVNHRWRRASIRLPDGGLWARFSCGDERGEHSVSLPLPRLSSWARLEIGLRADRWSCLITLPRLCAWALTFLTVHLLWVPFRAETFADAWNVLRAMAAPPQETVRLSRIIATHKTLFAACCLAFFAPTARTLLARFKPNTLWLLLLLAGFFTAFFHLNNYSQFLYFQF